MTLASRLSRHVAFPLWAWKDSSHVQRYLREVESNQFLEHEPLEELRWRRLRALLEHAYENVPHYRRRFDEAGCVPSDIRSWDEFARLPHLRRADLQQEPDALRTRALPDPGDRFVSNFTGGSTVEPARFWSSQRRKEYAEASTIRHDRWAGWEIGETMGVLWGASRDLGPPGIRPRLRRALLERRIMLDASSLDRARMLEFVAALRARQPRFWLSYARLLSLFLRFLEQNGITDLRPQAIISSAEVLEPGVRERARQQLGCEVFDRYGTREFGLIASECGRHPSNALHVNADAVVVEVADDGIGPSKLLVTDLLNYAMPFVRYEIGDVGQLCDEPCPCGRSLPMMKPIEGRSSDFITTGDGRVVSGKALSVYLLGKLESVQQGQIVQERRGEVVLRLVLAKDADANVASDARRLCQSWLGDASRVEIDLVEEIPRSPTGKLCFAISSVDPMESLS